MKISWKNISSIAEYTVPPEEYGAFLCAVFDQWKSRDIGKIKIQIFEEALRTAFNQDPTPLLASMYENL
ncbi:MAG: hypothetical protein R6X28_04895 [Bacteroidales bacterium]